MYGYEIVWCVNNMLVGLLCYEARLEQFDHFNLVSKWPLYLYLLKFPMNGIFLWFERCLRALGFVKRSRAWPLGTKLIHLSHQMSTRTLCSCMVSIFMKLRKSRGEGRGPRGSLKKTLSLPLCFSSWQVFIFSPVYPGNQVLPPGASLGSGLTPEAAKDLGLPPGIAVAASLIDAHAGGLGNVFLRVTTSTMFRHSLGSNTLLFYF